MEIINNRRQLSVRFMTIGISGALAVALGALGAHALKNELPSGKITADQLAGFETAVRYHMYHTFAMLFVVLIGFHMNARLLKWTFNLFITGIILFSGSLYLLCTRNLLDAEWLRFLGPVTPLGGLCLITGWLSLAFSAFKKG
jgi:uncharacterized membrane protein YgdD (TMEM256/DUF423 family)